MKRFSLILLALMISLPGCSTYRNARQEEYESAVIYKDSETVVETRYINNGKGGMLPYNSEVTYYYLYVMNPLETTGKDVKMSVGRTIWENTEVGSKCILVLFINQENKIVDVALRGDKGLVGSEAN